MKTIITDKKQLLQGDKYKLIVRKRVGDGASVRFYNEVDSSSQDIENISDGYHTFKELYEFRKIYNAALFNEWYSQGKYDVVKSEKHSDGELCFGGGWFIVQAQTPFGQVSNHYEMKDWDLFKCEAVELPLPYDGHTAEDVLFRLKATAMSKEK